MKLPKSDVLEKLRVSLRLLGRDHNTIESYTRTAGHFYAGDLRDLQELMGHPQLDRAESPLVELAPQLKLTA